MRVKSMKSFAAAAIQSRSKKESKIQSFEHTKIEQAKQMVPMTERCGCHRALKIRFCVSCPELVPATRARPYLRSRHISPPRTRPVSHEAIKCSVYSATQASSYLLQANGPQITSIRAYSKPSSCGSPCPFPCGPCGCPSGCGCLPPPCNQPPKCIQYMTGYYYYPYGYWFCGPYHVAGTCTPVGPCGPSCGPCPACCAPCPPPGKTPAPACMCPAAAAVVGVPDANCKIAPKGNIITGPKISFPSKDKPSSTQQPRSSISKFFPFNATCSPGVGGTISKDGKKPPTPPYSPVSGSKCPYSTQAPRKSFYHKEKPTYCTSCDNAMGFTTQFQASYSRLEESPSPNQVPEIYLPGFSRSFSDSMHKEKRSTIRHKRCRRYPNEVCPTLDRPRTIMTREDRDRPKIKPGLFDYSSIPQFRCPYPHPNNR